VLYSVLRPLTALVLRLGCGFRSVGADHVPREGAVLLAANHVSALDPPAIGAGTRRHLHYMAKAELFQVFFLGWLIRSLNAHPVEREGADVAALRHARHLLREGKALLVFPEGTRQTAGVLGPGRAGAGMLAAHSGAPVIPVYIQGTGQVLPRGATRPHRAPILVAYGPPLRFTRARGKERYQAISDEIMAAIARLKAEVEGRPAPGSAPIHNAEPARRGPWPAGQIH
jgi:1-acyl-sn-glycerol-3-phosphate acyltransferase